MISASCPLLLATDSTTDSALVSGLLDDALSISVCWDAARIEKSFAHQTPSAPVRAFRDVARARRYYLGLGRVRPGRRALSYRTVLLCKKDDVGQACAPIRGNPIDPDRPFQMN